MSKWKDVTRTIGIIAVLWAFMSLIVLATVTSAHCSTTEHKNSLGVPMYQENPNQYLEGSFVNGSIHTDGKREFTTVRFAPTNTYGLFVQEVTFCGDKSDLFNGKRGTLVLTYSRVMHQTWCYDLYSVHEVKEEKP